MAPGDTTVGSTPTVEFQRMLLARRDLDDEVVFAITQVLTEQRQELANAIVKENESVRPLIAHITEPSGDLGFTPPVHPGARAYYNHLQVPFVVTHANEIALGFGALMVMALWIKYFQEKGALARKRQADKYNFKVMELLEQTVQADTASELAAVKTELLRLLMRALQDRDKGRVSEELFDSFHSVWETAMDVAKAWHAKRGIQTKTKAKPAKFKWKLERYMHPK